MAEVDLSHADHHTHGKTHAPAWQDLEYSAVARATLEALSPEITDVDFLDGYLLRMADGELVVIVLRWNNEVYTGSAYVKRHTEDAIARATLDALNRVITRNRPDPVDGASRGRAARAPERPTPPGAPAR